MTQRTETQQAPAPQPEHDEPKLETAEVGDLSARDWFAIAVRAGKEMLDDNMTMIASALAYSHLLRDPVGAARRRSACSRWSPGRARSTR